MATKEESKTPNTRRTPRSKNRQEGPSESKKSGPEKKKKGSSITWLFTLTLISLSEGFLFDWDILRAVLAALSLCWGASWKLVMCDEEVKSEKKVGVRVKEGAGGGASEWCNGGFLFWTIWQYCTLRALHAFHVESWFQMFSKFCLFFIFLGEFFTCLVIHYGAHYTGATTVLHIYNHISFIYVQKEFNICLPSITFRGGWVGEVLLPEGFQVLLERCWPSTWL